jgi:hypothetical protein
MRQRLRVSANETFHNTMSASIETAANGLITIKITGKLTQPEWLDLQKESGTHIQQFGRARVLIITENFQGWERKGDWGDVSFQAKYDKAIERMAIVAEKKWEDLTLMFTAKGLRPFPIEFFEPSEVGRAKAWIAESGETPSR